MKNFAIIISLAFLGVSHSVSGAFPGDTFQDGICSVVRAIKICPPNPFPCAYEEFENDGRYGFQDSIMKRPCGSRDQSINCRDFDENEKECLKSGCTWRSGITVHNNQVLTNCDEFTCDKLMNESACAKYGQRDGCKWSKEQASCLEKGEEE